MSLLSPKSSPAGGNILILHDNQMNLPATRCWEIHQEEWDLVVLTDVEHSVERLSISDFLKLTDAIQPKVLEIAITIACKIGRAARCGKRPGAIFMLAITVRVLENSKQLIPNPVQGHDEDRRRLTNPDIHDAIVELAKLDGAFVIRGDGLIQTSGTFLISPKVKRVLPAGLGARHSVYPGGWTACCGEPFEGALHRYWHLRAGPLVRFLAETKETIAANIGTGPIFQA